MRIFCKIYWINLSSRNLTKNSLRIPKGISRKNSEVIQKGISGKLARGIPEGISGNVSEGVQEETPESVPD